LTFQTIHKLGKDIILVEALNHYQYLLHEIHSIFIFNKRFPSL